MPRQVVAEARDDLVDEHVLLRVVDRLDRVAACAASLAVLARGAHQRLHVLREARAAVAGARIEEVVADARIGADAAGAPPRCRRRRCSARLASSFMKQMRVASIALAAYLVSSAERTSITSSALVVAVERRVELLRMHARCARVVVGADDDAVRPHEVVDRRAFLQELRVRHDGEVDARRRALRSSSAIAARTLSAVPTGTVDLSTITL